MLCEQELDEKLASLTEENIENLEDDQLRELVEKVYGEQEEYEEDEPKRPELKLKLKNDETPEQGLARITMEPEVRAAVSMLCVNNPGFDNDAFDLNALIEELNRQTALVKNKDSSRAEEMLTAQTHILDLLFNRLVATAEANISGGYLEAAGTYLKLAMKSQTQCRTTWEAISKIQNPPIANYVKQQNVAHNQQVNNGEENKSPPSKLAEGDHELLPDKRDAGAAIPVNPRAQAVGALDRAKVGAG